MAERESCRLTDGTLQPPAYDKGSFRRKQLVELIAAVGDFASDVLAQRSGPRQSRGGAGEIHIAQRLVPADNRSKVLAHTDEPGPRVLEYRLERRKMARQITPLLADDTPARAGCALQSTPEHTSPAPSSNRFSPVIRKY